MQYLIIGANSNIGSYIYKRMKEDGLDVAGTGHVRNRSDELIYYDILQDNIDNILNSETEKLLLVIICVAVANIDQCLLEQETAHQINIVKTKELIQYFKERNVPVICFSSEYVFAGEKGGYTEDDITNPVNQYGCMKAKMEKYIVEEAPNVCAFRISKVVYAEKIEQNVFWQWEQLWKKGETIKCIEGNRMSFVCIEDIYQACRIANDLGLRGIYNVSGDISYSRKELAEKFFDIVGAEEYKIVEQEEEKFGFAEKRPMDVSLNNHKFKEITGYQFTSMEMVIRTYIQNNKLKVRDSGNAIDQQ